MPDEKRAILWDYSSRQTKRWRPVSLHGYFYRCCVHISNAKVVAASQDFTEDFSISSNIYQLQPVISFVFFFFIHVFVLWVTNNVVKCPVGWMEAGLAQDLLQKNSQLQLLKNEEKKDVRFILRTISDQFISSHHNVNISSWICSLCQRASLRGHILFHIELLYFKSTEQ